MRALLHIFVIYFLCIVFIFVLYIGLYHELLAWPADIPSTAFPSARMLGYYYDPETGVSSLKLPGAKYMAP